MRRAEPTAAEILLIREIDERYAGEWALIKILDPPVPMAEAPGVVLAHGPDRQRMSKELVKAHRREPDALFTVMLGGGKFGDGDALRRALDRIAAEEEFVSVNPW